LLIDRDWRSAAPERFLYQKHAVSEVSKACLVFFALADALIVAAQQQYPGAEHNGPYRYQRKQNSEDLAHEDD
jgi:hypothetical protein